MKKRLLTLFFFVFSISSIYSITLYSRTSTGFYTPGTWSTVSCSGAFSPLIPSAADNIIICAGHTVTCNTAIEIGPGGNCASLTIQNGGTLNMEPSGTLTVKNGGFLTINAGGNLFVDTFINNNNSDGVVINGTLTVSSVFDNGVGADIIGSGTISLGPGATYANDGTIFGPTVLPVELVSFIAKPEQKTIELFWTTASEKNNDYFTIEKSINGYSYENIGIVDGAGTSTSVINYSFSDNSPFDGVSYYRLKQTDYNGDYKYSELVSVDFSLKTEFSFELFPNPNSGENINLKLSSDKDEEVLVVVYDISGKESYSKIIITEDTGESVYAIDPSNKLAPGIYLISATSKQTIYCKKLVVR